MQASSAPQASNVSMALVSQIHAQTSNAQAAKSVSAVPAKRTPVKATLAKVDASVSPTKADVVQKTHAPV